MRIDGAGQIYIGDRAVDEIYVGDNLVWPPGDGEFAYRLNAPAEVLALSVPGAEKLTPSADEQSGTLTLTFSGAARMVLMAGNFDMVNPTTIGQINYLNDMSYGTGDFVYELHVGWPDTDALVTQTFGAFSQLTTIGGQFLQMGAYLHNADDSSTILTARIYDDEGEGVKKYSVWADGVGVAIGLLVSDLAPGIDLSALYAAIYSQEPATSPDDQSKFTSPSPQITSRLITDPAEMVHASTVLARTAKTIIGDGQVVIP